MLFLIPILISFVSSILITPLIKRLAFRIGATDQPESRKVHTKIMPRLGGLAIYISFIIGFLLFIPNKIDAIPVVIGATIIVLVGILDDIYCLPAKIKFFGQIIAALVPVLGGIQIDFVTIPEGQKIYFGYFSVLITIFWIVAITNSINLIDGLDGLAAGVSSIALLTISILSFSLGNPMAFLLGLILFGSTVGFLIFNFYPAKIFMGDTGSLFLGYMISVLSIIGLTKSAAIFSLIIPIIILGVPIIDTTSAIVRRMIQKKPISAPDKFHLHHSIIRLGFSHRQAVILIYLLSGLFSLFAIIFTRATIWGGALIIVSLLVLIELIVEITGIISSRYRPILNLIESRRNNSE